MFQPSRGVTRSNANGEAQIRSPVKDVANKIIATTTSLPLIPRVGRNKRPSPSTNWHEKIKESSATDNWDVIRNWLSAIQPSSHDSSFDFDCSKTSMNSNPSSETSQRSARTGSSMGSPQKTSGGFWNRLIKRNPHVDRYGLMSVDEENRTPLHALLKASTDQALVLAMITAEPRAASVKTSKDRLPLHFAVVHRHSWPVIAAIIDAYPAGLSSDDTKGMSPLQYAMGNAIRESAKETAPRTYWMKLADDHDRFMDKNAAESSLWQEAQKERWAVVHWLLLSSATHPQSSLNLGSNGRKNTPMLVEALVHAAPPTVVSLLIGASVMMLSYDRKVSAFAASTLYTCITRHYPESILRSVASQLLVFRDKGGRYDKVRDETGVGFVAAQYISGCFMQSQGGPTQEWELSKNFFGLFEECIEDGEIAEHELAMLDWWMKLEHLIAFCAAAKNIRTKARRKSNHPLDDETNPSQLPRKYLLHAALNNTDSPPTVVKALLSFYPESIQLPDSSGALPLHLVSTVRDYIPRKYEREAFSTRQQYKSSLELILQADPSALWKRWNDLLPFHYAVACGRTIDSLKQLLEFDPEKSQLLRRDPTSGLYPFQVAATYSNKSDDDGFRWTCVARNRFSNSSWQEKPDRNKAGEVLKVAEADHLLRLETIYLLLRLAPRAILGPNHREYRHNLSTHVGKCSNDVAKLYLQFCYDYSTKNNSYEEIPTNKNLLKVAEAQFLANKAASLPSEFTSWWEDISSSLRELPTSGFERDLMLLPFKVTVSSDSKMPLLHRALMSDSIPPQVISLVIASEVDQLTASLEGSSLLPMHIVCLSGTPYRRKHYETFLSTALELLLEADPLALLVPLEGCLPLHMAIYTRKGYHFLESIINTDHRALRIPDRHSGLLPFQLIASYFSESGNHQSKPQNPESVSNSSIQHLNLLYLLLRRDPGAVTAGKYQPEDETKNAATSSESSSSVSDSSASSEDDSSESSSSFGSIAGSVGISIVGSHTAKSTRSTSKRVPGDTSSATDESSFVAASKIPRSPIRTKTPSSLMLLLSKSTVGRRSDEMFDCDASVLSNVDVLSTLTSTLHTKANRKSSENNQASDSEESFDLFDSDDEDGSVTATSASDYDDFAEDSAIHSMDLPLLVTKALTDDESVGGCSIESEVFFMVRRVARFAKSGKAMDDTPALVTLTKKTPRALLSRLKGHSFSSRSTKDPPSRPSVLKASSHSRLSFKSHEKRSLRDSKEVIWEGNDFFKSSLPSYQIREGESTEMSSLSASSSKSLADRKINAHGDLLGIITTDPSDAEDSNSIFGAPVNHESRSGGQESKRSLIKTHHAMLGGTDKDRGKKIAPPPITKNQSSLLGVDDYSETNDSIFAESTCGDLAAIVPTSTPGPAEEASSFTCIAKSDGADTDLPRSSNAKQIPGIVQEHGNGADASVTPHSMPKRFDKTTMRWVLEPPATQLPMKVTSMFSAETNTDTCQSANVHFPSRPTALRHNPHVRKPLKSPRRKLHAASSDDVPENQIRCVMCRKANREILMVPCKHLCICRKCSSGQKNLPNCPLCGAAVLDRMVIF